MKASDVAYKAADYISEHGHCKGVSVDFLDRACLFGAIAQVTPDKFLHAEIADTAYQVNAALAEVSGQSQHTLVTWNDEPGTTGEDVILLLKNTGRHLEEKGL